MITSGQCQPVHSVLERGSDQDVLELKELVKKDKEIAIMVYECSKHSDIYGYPKLLLP